MNRRSFFSALWNGRVRPVFVWVVLLLLVILLVNFDLSSFKRFSLDWRTAGGLIFLLLPIIAIIFCLALVSYAIQEFVPASYKRIARVFLKAVSIPVQLAIICWGYYIFYQKRNYGMIILITVLLGISLFKEYRKKRARPESSNTPV